MHGWLIHRQGYRDLWMLIVTILVAWAVIATYTQANETHRSLCTLRGDLERRVDASIRFLAENPRGIPGVPVRVIQDGVANQQRTIAALRGLNCK